MNLFERLSRYLQAPADGGAGGSGGGGEGGGGAGGAGAGAGDKGGAGGGAGAGDGKGGGDGKPKDGAGAKGASDGKGGTGDDAGSGAGKAGEAGKPAAGEYVVKVPEGAQVDKARLDAFTQEAKAAGITAEQASKLVAYEVAQEKGRAESWAKQGDAWHGQLEKDPEFGGSPEKVKESEASLQKALKRFDTGGELAKDLEKYGIDNLPSLAKFLARIGRADGEDTGLLETTKADPNAKLSPTERRSRFYTDMQPKK